SVVSAAPAITPAEFSPPEIGGQTIADALMTAGRELLRLQPAEIVRPAGAGGDHLPVPEAAWLPDVATRSESDGWRWRQDRAEDLLQRHFGVGSLGGFGLGDKPLAARAAGALLHYLLDTQLTGLKQITSLRTYSTDAYMTLDLQTRRNL